MSLQEFFHMGGYAFYVWTSYGIAAVVLVANIIRPLALQRRLRRELNQKYESRRTTS